MNCVSDSGARTVMTEKNDEEKRAEASFTSGKYIFNLLCLYVLICAHTLKYMKRIDLTFQMC